MTSNKRTLTKILLTLALVFLPQLALAQTNTFPTSGNAGIGTTTPAVPLEVRGAGITSRVTATGTTGAHGKFQIFSADITNNPFAEMQFYAPTGAGSEYLRFNIANSSGSVFADILSISRLGNVGIGTTTPGYRLDVQSNAQWAARFKKTDATHGGILIESAAGYNPNVALSVNGTIKWFMNTNVAQSDSLQFWESTGMNPRFTLTQAGNVGIGTTSPGYQLDVQSNAQWAARFKKTDATHGGILVETAAGYNPNLALSVNGTIKWYMNSNGAQSDSLQFWESTGQTPRFTLTQAGNVGIGNSAPSEKLHVTGNGKFTGNLIVDGIINAKYQDVAEWVPSTEQLAAGTVVVLDTTKSDQVIASTVGYDTRVAGVISAQPGITLGEGGEGKVLVATTGRVRVKVDASRGPIQIGDLLVTSDIPGVAMKSEAVNLGGVQIHRPGTIIGKALEPLAKGSGEILVLLSLQ